ncbi:MAG: SCP2 sterol-binding domain-containing protein [Deltaproteobacteria bacterium]|nr:MAG: SCP2 sterol-binding domain-containing protein [Deltaproteobacteria bacterium]
MPEFPRSPVAPAELLERYLPAAFAATPRPEQAAGVALALGVRLVGEGGGEWVLDVGAGDVRVRAGSRAETAFSYVQSVDDWRGALWEGRGGAVGRGAAALFRPGAREVEAAVGLVGAGIPAAIASLRELRGLLHVVVSDSAGDWRVGLQLGPGEIPTRPTTEVCLSATDADQMATGDLKPIEAFMAGRIRILGDMGLVLQMQAAQMQAAAGAGKG